MQHISYGLDKAETPNSTQRHCYWDHKSRREDGVPVDNAHRKDLPPRWPPDDEHKIDTFDGKRPNGIKINPERRQLYCLGRRRPINPDDDLFNTVGKLRFKRALTRASEVGLNFRRIAGQGGNGLVAIFETSSVPAMYKLPGAPAAIVVKLSLRPGPFADDEIEKEKTNMDTMRRAQHIVQRILDQDVFNKAGLAWVASRPNNIFRDDPTPIAQGGLGKTIVMEYMRLGTLHQQLIRLNTANRIVGGPDEGRRSLQEEECWRMLECLVKACVGLKYPPMLQEDEDGEFLDEDGPGVPETIPDPAISVERNIVHFDIDPQNIFLGAYADPTTLSISAGTFPGTVPHLRAPPFKIGDLGSAEEWTEESGNPKKEDKVWLLRGEAKPNYFRPEQFTVEWDGYSENPIDGEPERPDRSCKKGPSKIAGRYSEKTNIWDVGLAMHIALTHCQPLGQPWAQEVSIRNPMLPVGVPDGNSMPVDSLTGLTHGWRLAEDSKTQEPYRWQHVSTRLREVVMQCLMHDPADRPSLEALLAEVTEHVRTEYSQETERPHALDAFNEPLPVPNSGYTDEFANILNGRPVGTKQWHAWAGSDIHNLVHNLKNWQAAVQVGQP